jgi:hypothetical protein
MRRKAQDRQVVATDLLALISVERLAQGLLLLAHRGPAILPEQLLETPLAEGPAARAADLVDL